MSAPAAQQQHRPTVADGHLFVDRLVADGLPKPDRAKVRAEAGELTLSLTLTDDEAFAAWRGELNTAGAVDPGPWRIGPVSARVAVGRIRGVRTVLSVEVEHVDERRPVTPGAASGVADRLRAAMARPRPTPGPRPLRGSGVTPPPAAVVGAGAPPTDGVLLTASGAGRSAGAAPAPDRSPRGGPAPESAVDTQDHDFRDLLLPDGRPRPVSVERDGGGAGDADLH